MAASHLPAQHRFLHRQAQPQSSYLHTTVAPQRALHLVTTRHLVAHGRNATRTQPMVPHTRKLMEISSSIHTELARSSLGA